MSTRSLLYWAALVAGAELAARGYLLDRPTWLHGGAWLLVAVAALTAWRRRERRPAAAALAALALVPALLSALTRASAGEAPATDPLADFWRGHAAERILLSEGVPSDGSVRSVELFGHSVALDGRGFRLREHTDRAAGAYRIVAVGGADTFGAVRGPGEHPWPEALEAAIRERLACAHPVEVWNAGAPGRGTLHAARRLEDAILPLEPRLLVVAPDPKDLELLAADLPVLRLAPSPPTPPRGSAPLRRVEATWRARRAHDAFQAARARIPPDLDPRDARLARAYRRLLVETRRHGVDVVLLHLQLAVAADSDPSQIARYEALAPGTRGALLALDVHRRVLARMGATYRATVVQLPAAPAAANEALFLDLHLRSERGRQALAEAVLEGIRPLLGGSPPGCAPREVREGSPS